jgi:hypothetical protein
VKYHYNPLITIKLIVAIILLAIGSASYSQVITGIVQDKKTGLKIDYAAIYFSGSLVGTYSDANGKFSLDISKNNNMPLTISAVGYNSVVLGNYDVHKPITITLEPKDYGLNEVVVKAKSLTRERKYNLNVFRDVFLGTSSNSRECRILNENDITFNYGSDRDTLKAYASKPIIIDNPALGYKITYFLDAFLFDKTNSNFHFSGNILFSEDMASVASKKEYYENNRRFAYLGSRMHFFRELSVDNLHSSGFIVQNISQTLLDYNDIVTVDPDHKLYLINKGKLTIIYKSKDNKSYIRFTKGRVYFDATGFFDATGISWEGQMADKRIGDMLPYEYIVKDSP